jgi:hypothetical protein
MNRAQKGWQTRYENEIVILQDQMQILRDEMYRMFMDFVNKTAKYQDLNREYLAMQKELERFEWKHKGGSSSDEAQGEN